MVPKSIRSMSSSSYAIIDRELSTLILLNAGIGDRVDLILDVDLTTRIVHLHHYYEGINKRLSFDDYKVIRIIFRTDNWSLVTARSNAIGQVLDHKAAKKIANFALLCEFKFLEAFENKVKINRLGEERLEYYEETLCAICHEEYKARDMMAELACKHGYHVECIKKWFTRNVSCPMCRDRVFPASIYIGHVSFR